MLLICELILYLFLEYLEFILYGLIQGFTEFIPVSSTAHLKIISLLFGIKDPGSSLSAIIQMGSVLAIFCYFRKNIFLISNTNSKNRIDYFLNKKLYRSIFIGSIPIILFGGYIKLFIPNFFESILRSNFSIALVSILMAILMYFADRYTKKSTDINKHNYLDSLLIGFFQSFAIIPGISRSGITISIALLSGWERNDAAKFSFLLGIPAISIAAIVEFAFNLNQFSSFTFFPLIVGLLTTFLSSLLAIDFLLKYLTSHGLKLFIYYRLIFGIILLLNL